MLFFLILPSVFIHLFIFCPLQPQRAQADPQMHTTNFKQSKIDFSNESYCFVSNSGAAQMHCVIHLLDE